ncbi:acetyl-CoA carboxylase biotin carboxylase subunit family protein [Streptomyces sp. Da 82-17]|uniref:ATP-grasp domain-containing protein n=1 Tax=Streptomyces sp. Da 82-17 TaxID=3377116 RepID=UPI0038D4C84F
MASSHIHVLGLDDKNLATLRKLPGADPYRFHGLLTRAELQDAETPVPALLERAERVLARAEAEPDAIVGYWDFPVSLMVPLLCARHGLRGPDLEAVLKCEHKYWSRLEQREVMDEVPWFALVDPDEENTVPDDIPFPVWLKPVKSYASQLALRAADRKEFDAALARIRDEAGAIGDRLADVLDLVPLPEQIEAAGPRACLAEEELSGAQATVEGYSQGGRVTVYGVVDSVPYPGKSSFLRYQYPSSLPAHLVRQLEDVTKRVISRFGLDDATFCVEYFCLPEKGRFSLLEINPRHSQSHAELFELVDGIANHHCMIRLALGENPQLPFRQGRFEVAAKWFLRRFTDGTVTARAGDAEIAELEADLDGVRVRPLVDAGTRLSEAPHTHDSYSYELAHLYIGAHDEQELRRKYDQCVSALGFHVEEVP